MVIPKFLQLCKNPVIKKASFTFSSIHILFYKFQQKLIKHLLQQKEKKYHMLLIKVQQNQLIPAGKMKQVAKENPVSHQPLQRNEQNINWPNLL